MKIVDKWWRHFAKTVSWRTIAFISLAALTYFYTGSFLAAGSIALVDLIIKALLYYTHEHVWGKLSFGREIIYKNGCLVWITGLSGSGKTTVADRVAEKLQKKLIAVSRIDGDVARRTFSSDLGFSAEDRAENCRRAAHAGAYAKESSIVLASFISPSSKTRDYVRELLRHKDVFIVQIVCPLEECKRRDPKGMYAKLQDGKFKGAPFTGCHPDAPYYYGGADLVLMTQKETVDESADRIINMLYRNGYL